MNWQRAALVVAVFAGAVEVEWDGKRRVLPAGEQEVFTAEAPASPWADLSSEAYHAATAHDPQFDNPDLWPPEIVAGAAYARETWPKSRVLVYANPGRSARDGSDPSLWLEDGKPAMRIYDAHTDLVLPPAENQYWVTIQGRKYAPPPYRHVTIGKDAGLVWQHSAGGNVWIQRGGTIRYLDSFVGDKHTFCRNDNDETIRLVDHLYVRKTGGASVEFLGPLGSEDQLAVHSGRMILGPGASFAAGCRTQVSVHPEAELVLLSGSYLYRRNNSDWEHDLHVRGTLLAGTPERPLTADCRIGLSYKSKGRFTGPKRDHRMPTPDDFGLFVAPEGVLRIHSADPRSARLVINHHRRGHDAGQVRILGNKVGIADELLGMLESLPRKVDMVLLGDVELDGVKIDDAAKGGILLPDLAARSGWRNIFYGENNAAAPAELYRIVENQPGGAP